MLKFRRRMLISLLFTSTFLLAGLSQNNAPRRGTREENRRDSIDTSGIERKNYRFSPTQEKIDYDVFFPPGLDKQKKAPLVVALHGQNVQPFMLLRSLTGPARQYQYIVVAPMGYNLQGGYGVVSNRTGTQPPNLADLSEADVMAVLDIMRSDRRVDVDRIYLLGQSMGGGGALHLMVKYPTTWAAVGLSAPAMGAQQPAALQTIKAVPMILVHGDADLTVSIARILPWVRAMRELNIPHEYHELPGVGHSDAIVAGAERIFAFFDKYSRN